MMIILSSLKMCIRDRVGPAIAEHLTIPHAAWVAEIVDVNEKAIQVRQDLVSVSQISEIPYPCLLTIDKDTCVPVSYTHLDVYKRQ